jgi:hypothetical protein
MAEQAIEPDGFTYAHIQFRHAPGKCASTTPPGSTLRPAI